MLRKLKKKMGTYKNFVITQYYVLVKRVMILSYNLNEVPIKIAIVHRIEASLYRLLIPANRHLS